MIRTLQSQEELRVCRDQLREQELDFSSTQRLRLWQWAYSLRYRTRAPIVDTIKSWDVKNALEVIKSTIVNPDEPILDMGCFNSEVLYAAYVLRYRQLHGCDLNPLCRWMPFWHRIRYQLADLTRTPYPDHHFAAITCLSVIEHGVPLSELVTEVARLLRPGGVFIFTTDYDATGLPHEIDPDLRMFGLSWKIFTPDTLTELIERFTSVGFTLRSPQDVNFSHSERPISWCGQKYTFVMVALTPPEA